MSDLTLWRPRFVAPGDHDGCADLPDDAAGFTRRVVLWHELKSSRRAAAGLALRCACVRRLPGRCARMTIEPAVRPGNCGDFHADHVATRDAATGLIRKPAACQ